MGIATVRGKFTEFEGTLAVADELRDSRAFGRVEVASITTADEVAKVSSRVEARPTWRQPGGMGRRQDDAVGDIVAISPT